MLCGRSRAALGACPERAVCGIIGVVQARRSSEFGRRHPVPVLIVTIVIFVVVVALFAGRLVLLRQWVPGSWALAAAVGVLAALAMIGLVSHGIRRKWSSGAFYWSSVLGVMVPFFYALGMRFPAGSSGVWVVLDVVACAYSAITMAALVIFLVWAVPKGIKRRRDAREHPPAPEGPAPETAEPGAVIIVVPQGRRWQAMLATVTHAGDSPDTCSLRAPTLTEADREAISLIAAKVAPDAANGFRVMTVMVPRRAGGPELRVAGEPGAFTATDPDHGVLSGQTLEDLVDAVRQVRGRRANFTLVWERPLASVPGATGSW